ncbi:sugar ABC transporter permease [Rhizobium leguminosarum]|uniref:carbohydrate ABC transporter permease n=1 Tax=Rhizobium ruizarguesonis TaxID=2081791 RepID=UPI0013DE9E94|nr:sugar ABC transporter permease [Rhizobium ruizarguesonis]MBC2807779.1 sugar ABC transporter permease [Rhizobium ruizarguesonis]MBY5853546.1 sugar ABC transporter permease [Rhizobium leguminosarum]NEJ92241.1 ABC transporter permease subunit [Rhizobium ruizarguesonis]
MTDIQADLARPITMESRRALPRKCGAGAAPWFYLTPALILLLVWTYIPLVEAFHLSFYQWNMLPTAPQRFVGFDNYRRLFALAEMRTALWNTVLYIVGLFPMSVVIPLFVAILTQDLQGWPRLVYRTLIFVPMIVAPVVAAVLWRWLLNDDHGLVNHWLEALGLGRIGFLTDPEYALVTLIWITGWKLIGFSTLLFSAANAGIDQSYIEAARIDGARRWRIIRDIRLPLLSPTILLLSMMTILFGAQWSFAYINVLTNGGPLKSTTNIFYLLWEYGFETMSAGWSAAAGMITFAGFAVIAFVCLRLMKRYAVYDN